MKKFFLSMITIILTLSASVAFAGVKDYTKTYLYGGTTTTYLNYISKTKGILSEVSPDYFVINNDGTLDSSKTDKTFINTMHEMGIKVVPFLSNNWDKPSGIAGLENAEVLSNQIRDVVYEYNLDGVDVDIQNVSEKYRDKYTAFVKMLREKMPDKTICVAVAANPNGWTIRLAW